MKILGIILTVMGVLGYALALGIAMLEDLNLFPIIIVFVSAIFLGIGIGIISTENERNNHIKK